MKRNSNLTVKLKRVLKTKIQCFFNVDLLNTS